MILKRTITPMFAASYHVLATGPGEPALVVDPGAGAARNALALLRSHQLTLNAILLTHGHADHVWGSQALIEAVHAEGLLISDDAVDVPVYIPGHDHYRLEEPDIATGISANSMTFTDMAGSEWRQPTDIRLFPGDSFSQAVELAPGIALRAVPAPSHSEGSALFFLEAHLTDSALLYKAEVIGDDSTVAGEERSYLVALGGGVVFEGSVGRTDLPGGDRVQVLAILRFLANTADSATILLPGHGTVTTMEHGRHGSPYFVEAKIHGGDLKA